MVEPEINKLNSKISNMKARKRVTNILSTPHCPLIFALAILAFTPGSGRGQEPSRTVEQIYQFDEHGDATIEFNFQLGKAQWDAWKMRFGDHPDEMLRSVNHDMATAVIDDFGLDKDDTHRSAKAHFKARALAQYRGNGQFEIPVPKTMKLVTGSGTDWAFTNSISEKTPMGAGLVNVTYRAKLPAGAQNAHVVNGNDFNRIAYSLELSSSKPKTLLYAGVGLIVAAIVLLILSARVGAPAPGVTRSLPPAGPPPGSLPST